MKILLQIILTILVFNSVFSQDLKGRYEGAVTRDGAIQLVNFDFYLDNGIQKGTYEIPGIGVYDVPVNNMKLKNDTLNINFYYGNFFCFVNNDKKQITGISESWLPKIRMHVKKSNNKVKPYLKEEITLQNKDITLSGMIYHPKKNQNHPVKYIVLIHGSGHQDRYAPYYISLSHELSKRGIGVLLYDKRGTGNSNGDFETASLNDLAEDALAGLSYLKNRKDLEISEIGFLGTSQGGWIATIVANKTMFCDFLILNVGPSVSVFEQDLHRVEYTMIDEGWEQTAIDSALTYTKLYFKYAKNNNNMDWEKLKSFSDEIHNRPWAEYINLAKERNEFDWWRNNDYNPSKTLENIKCRTLCLFGELDRLVPPNENLKKMEEYLSIAKIDFNIKVIKGAYHNMQTSQGLNGKNWDWPKVYWQWRTQPAEFINSIVEFINN